MSIPILTTVYPGGTPNFANAVFYVSNATPVQPSQRVTVAQYPAGNPAFSRAVQVSSEYVFVKRGAAAFAIPLVDLCGIAAGMVPALSYSPLIVLQPSALTITHGGGNYAIFNTSANSESAVTYGWAVNNGASWVTNISNTSNNGAGKYSLVSPTSLKITPTSNSPSSYLVLCSVVNATGTTNTAQVTLTVL